MLTALEEILLAAFAVAWLLADRLSLACADLIRNSVAHYAIEVIFKKSLINPTC